MLAIIQQFIINNIKVLGAINILLIAAAMLHRAYKSIYGEYATRVKESLWPRVEDYLQSASRARHMPTMDLRPNERHYVYDILLSYAQYYNLDIHEIFDANGFTRERIEKLWTRKNPQLLRELAVLKSPQAEDLLFARLSETSGEEAYRVAHALAATELSLNNQKRMVKNVIKNGVNVERCIDIFVSLHMPVQVLMEMLYEQDSPRGEKVLLRTIASATGLDEDWIVDDLRPYLFHSQDVVIAAVMALAACRTPYAFELLHTEYYNNLSWEVRSAIARVAADFEPRWSIPLLKAMTLDNSWWVRFNAIASLNRLGMDGEDALYQISRESRDPALADFVTRLLAGGHSAPEALPPPGQMPSWLFEEDENMEYSMDTLPAKSVPPESASATRPPGETAAVHLDKGSLPEVGSGLEEADSKYSGEPESEDNHQEEVPDEQPVE